MFRRRRADTDQPGPEPHGAGAGPGAWEDAAGEVSRTTAGAGGPWDVTGGMLTITWHESGICGISV